MKGPLCTCDNPFCFEDHAPLVPSIVADEDQEPDDATGPDQEGLGYSEYDPEAYDEMVREDMAMGLLR